MANQATQPTKPKNALAAAAARKAAIVAAQPAVPAAIDDFDKDPDSEAAEAAPVVPEEEPEPEVRTRKKAAQEAAGDGKKGSVELVVKPTDDFVRNKKGEIRKEEDGEDMRYAPGFHKGAGFVNSNGVRFPVGFKFKGGFIGTFGNVILNRCPICHYHQSVDAAREGKCDNERAGPDKTRCGFNQIRELEEIEIA